MIPQHTIQDIRDRAADDIVDIIGSYIPLKRSGSSYKAKCPFHDENTASFSVSEPKGIYKCFGCGEGGDAVDFIIKHTGKEFITVIKELARRYMIDISDSTGTKKRSYGRSNAEIYEAVLPGLRAMKAPMRRNDKIYLLFDDAFRNEMADSAPWLSVDLPVSRGQYQIISKYAGEVILMGKKYDTDVLLQSVKNGLTLMHGHMERKINKRGITGLSIWAENGYKQGWLGFLMDYHPEKNKQIQRIIPAIPNEMTYQIYRNSYIENLKSTSKS